MRGKKGSVNNASILVVTNAEIIQKLLIKFEKYYCFGIYQHFRKKIINI